MKVKTVKMLTYVEAVALYNKLTGKKKKLDICGMFTDYLGSYSSLSAFKKHVIAENGKIPNEMFGGKLTDLFIIDVETGAVFNKP